MQLVQVHRQAAGVDEGAPPDPGVGVEVVRGVQRAADVERGRRVADDELDPDLGDVGGPAREAVAHLRRAERRLHLEAAGGGRGAQVQREALAQGGQHGLGLRGVA
ncbi:MAG: hypothetical protein ACK559_20885, partial [bacterium]